MRQKANRLEILTFDRPSLCWAGISLSRWSLWVQHTIDVTNEGQLRISGLVPDLKVTGPTRFGILISVDNAETIRLPAGAQGSAAILTGRMQFAGVFRMALMRSQSYLNYIF